MKTILLISPYWKEDHRWMVSSVKLAELWQRLGYRVITVCMSEVENGKRKVEKVSDTLEIHRLQDIFLKDPWNTGIAPLFSLYVLRLIKQEKPDHIVCNKLLFWSSFPTIPLLFLCGHRVTVLVDALVGMTWWPRGTLPKIIAALSAWTAGWMMLLMARRVVFFHPQPEKLLKDLWIYRKSQVIPTGIDVLRYRSEVRGQRSEVVVSYVGRLESIKGVDDFLAALVPLKADYPNLHLQVVGWHADDHPLVDQYQNDVSFVGLRDDIPDILSQTDIFVMPSHSEGLSNAIMEAMSSGCACIVSAVGGNTFLVQNGVSGFHFPAGDRAALAAHVRRLMEDPAKRDSLGKAARKRIEEVFDWKVVGGEYEELFGKDCRL